jgi:ABC-type multidrug transport system fused ATPase/permease subunit
VTKDGVIVQSGKYEDLIADPTGELVRQMAAHRRSLNQVNPPQEDNPLTGGSSQLNQNEVTEEKFEAPTGTGRFSRKTQEEVSETGRVKWSVYSTFITSAYKGALVPIILLCQVLFQGLQMGSNYWIAWATEKSHNVTREKLIGIFILLSGGSSIFILGRAVLLATIAVETAQRLFFGMISSVFRATISFFDTTPSSRILSRVSFFYSKFNTLCFVYHLYMLPRKKHFSCVFVLAVIYRSKHSRYRHPLQIGWIGICPNSAIMHRYPYVSGGLAGLPYLSCHTRNLHLVSGKAKILLQLLIIFSLN